MFTNQLFSFLRPIVLFTMVLFSSIVLPAFADESEKSPSDYLSDYIERVCKKDCVDGDLLRVAVDRSAMEFDIDPIALFALVEIESGFRVHAVNKSSGRSVGLSQVQVYWHRKKFLTEDPYDIFDNVRVGAIVYSDCLKRHKGVRDKALWCYNGHQKRGMKTYVPKATAAYKRLSKLPLQIVVLQ